MNLKSIIERAISYTPQNDTNYIDRYVKRQKALKVISVCTSVIAVICLGLGYRIACDIALALAFLLVFLYYFGKRRLKATIRNSLDKNCDPSLLCDYIFHLDSLMKTDALLFENIWNFIRGLKYWGRFDDMSKVLTVARASIRTPRDAFLYNCAMLDYAFETKDLPLSEAYLPTILQLDASISNRKHQEMKAIRVLENELLKLEQLGQNEALYTYYLSVDEHPKEQKLKK